MVLPAGCSLAVALRRLRRRRATGKSVRGGPAALHTSGRSSMACGPPAFRRNPAGPATCNAFEGTPVACGPPHLPAGVVPV